MNRPKKEAFLQIENSRKQQQRGEEGGDKGGGGGKKPRGFSKNVAKSEMARDTKKSD